MVSAPKKAVLGVLGGSGIYQIDGLEIVKEHKVVTPYGDPSDVIFEGKIGETSVFFLPRHGRSHRFLPQEVPYQANIAAMKMLGVTHLLAVSAVGIMQEAIHPGDMIVPDQLFDRTMRSHCHSFFGNGIVGHVGTSDPFCHEFSQFVAGIAERHAKVHRGGAYVCVEGPRFSTRSESHFFRKTLDPAVIGMTAAPEAYLAREAELSYAMVAMGTDYDCWHEEQEAVTTEAVMEVLHKNSHKAKEIVKSLALSMSQVTHFPFVGKTRRSILTPVDKIPEATKQKFVTIFGTQWLNDV